jgi:hypothetical protein
MFKNNASGLKNEKGLAQIAKVKELTKIAESESAPYISHSHLIPPPLIGLGSTPTALALAWLAKNPNTSTIILGVTSVHQLKQNLEALKVLPKITDEHLAQIEKILDNKPEPFVCVVFFVCVTPR